MLEFLSHQKIFYKTCMRAVKVAMNFQLILKRWSGPPFLKYPESGNPVSVGYQYIKCTIAKQPFLSHFLIAYSCTCKVLCVVVLSVWQALANVSHSFKKEDSGNGGGNVASIKTDDWISGNDILVPV